MIFKMNVASLIFSYSCELYKYTLLELHSMINEEVKKFESCLAKLN